MHQLPGVGATICVGWVYIPEPSSAHFLSDSFCCCQLWMLSFSSNSSYCLGDLLVSVMELLHGLMLAGHRSPIQISLVYGKVRWEAIPVHEFWKRKFVVLQMIESLCNYHSRTLGAAKCISRNRMTADGSFSNFNCFGKKQTSPAIYG